MASPTRPNPDVHRREAGKRRRLTPEARVRLKALIARHTLAGAAKLLSSTPITIEKLEAGIPTREVVVARVEVAIDVVWKAHGT